jgi:hypothetical protein
MLLFHFFWARLFGFTFGFLGVVGLEWHSAAARVDSPPRLHRIFDADADTYAAAY